MRQGWGGKLQGTSIRDRKHPSQNDQTGINRLVFVADPYCAGI